MTIDEFFEMQARSTARWGLSPEIIVEHNRKAWAELPLERRAAHESALNIDATSTAEAVIAYMRMFESDVRSEVLAEWGENVCGDSDKFWRVVREVWNECDLIPHERFEQLFDDHCVDWYIGRRELPESIGETVTVYRGQDVRGEVGLSWTLSRKVAENFAHGHRCFVNPNPMVGQREVQRDDIVFFDDSRNEQEVVLRDWLCGSKTQRYYVDGVDVTDELTAKWRAEKQAEAAE